MKHYRGWFLLLFFISFVAGVWIYLPQTEFKKCETLSTVGDNYEETERYLCYAKILQNLTNLRGPAKAVTELNTYREKDIGGKEITLARCHSLGHIIGQVAVRADYSMEDIMTQCGASCAGGCINGAVHTYFFEGSTMEELEKYCNSEQNNHTVIDACYHGIGHAVIEYTQLDVPLSIEKCSEIKDENGRFQCGHAIFMDQGILSSAPNSKLPSNVVNLCANIDYSIKTSCYEFAGFIEYARDENIESAFATCRQVESNYQELCQRRIAEALAYRYHDRIYDLLDECAKGNKGEFYNCAMHASLVIENSVSISEIPSPNAICQRFPDDQYTMCLEEISENKILINTE